jgi:NAD(P)-dependent dehydrogenase (short-subunit alcohol dehydrogenase family)
MTSASAPPAPTGSAVGRELRGATVVLTGVGRPGQVGEVVAGTFAQRGVRLVLVAHTLENAERVAVQVRELGGEVHPLACDLADPAQVAALSREVAALAPNGVRGLVLLAGGWGGGEPVADLDPAAWHHLISINLTTAFVTSRAFLPLLRMAGGNLVFFSSAAALPGANVARSSAYAAAKGGVITVMRAIASEERANGLRANALAPLAIRTAANLRSMGEEHRYVERESVAEWVWWLCSDASAPASGQVIRLG